LLFFWREIEGLDIPRVLARAVELQMFVFSQILAKTSSKDRSAPSLYAMPSPLLAISITEVSYTNSSDSAK
jgi:hypothetical protein